MEGNSNYWLRRRFGRRAMVRGAGTTGLGAAAYGLVGCGDDDDNGADAGSPTSAPTSAATASQAASGGGARSLTFSSGVTPTHLDPYLLAGFAVPNHGMVYSRLYRHKAGTPDFAPAEMAMEPDLAATMPEQVDPLTYVVKLKPGLKFQNVAPVNGRPLTATDVTYAFDRYRAVVGSPHLVNLGQLDKVEAVDPQTVKFTTKSPYADFVNVIGGWAGTWISPKEFAEGPDAKTKMVGTGPFLFEEYQQGVSIKYRKNPDYLDKAYPVFDTITEILNNNSATRAADFIAKKVNVTGWFGLAADRERIKKERPDAKTDTGQGAGSFLHLRTDKPPFNDRRVRQAISMALNRKAFRDAFSGGEGVPEQMYPAAFLTSRQVKDLPQAKYWEFNLAEAKKLMAAAIGEGKTIESTLVHVGDLTYGADYITNITMTQAQLKEIGINVKLDGQTYAPYVSNVYLGGNYEGMGHSPRALPQTLDFLTEKLTNRPARGRVNLSYVSDSKLDDLLDKQRGQFKADERLQTIRQIEELLAEEQYEIYYSTAPGAWFWDADLKDYRPSAWAPWTHLMKASRA